MLFTELESLVLADRLRLRSRNKVNVSHQHHHLNLCTGDTFSESFPECALAFQE